MTPTATLAVSREFFRGYELCRGNGLPATNGKLNALVPSVVCLAFSAELGLKSVLLKSRQGTTGHKLNELFELLEKKDQDSIVEICALDKKLFDVELSLVSGAFVEWRYIHEKDGMHSINLEFLLKFRGAVDSIAEANDQALRAQIGQQSQ